jgi:DNA-binding beta-propeller fold protein YncE
MNPNPVKTTAMKYPLILKALSALVLSTVPLEAGTLFRSGADAQLVLGQSDFISTGSSDAAIYVADPQGICVDPVTGKVFVADHFNHRVLRYASAETLTNGAAAEIVLGQSAFLASAPGTTEKTMREPFDLAIDADGNLWVADTGNHVVRKIVCARSSASATPSGYCQSVLHCPEFE